MEAKSPLSRGAADALNELRLTGDDTVAHEWAHAVTQHVHVSQAAIERMGRLRLTGELEGLL